jgi:hypothetical protein
MEEFEVNIDGSGTHKAPGAEHSSSWCATSPPPPQVDNADQRRRRCGRRRNICICFGILLLCAIVAAAVVPTKLARRNTPQVAAATGSDTEDNQDDRVCNGLASNCYRRVNEIMYPTVHNAMSALENGFAVAYNNIYSLEDALDMGFRGLQMDSCACTGLGTQFCHKSCAVGYRGPVTVFKGIRDFLQKNENEVVILELQIGVDSFDGLYEKMLEVGNLTSLMYNHPDRTARWPIINDLIANNTRLIIFQHDGPDCNAGLCPPGFHNTYEFVFETTFNATGVEGLMAFNETCVRTRGRKGSAFMLSNHFATNSLGLPEQDIAEEVNMADNIRDRTDACTEMLQRQTNLLAVDYWSIGDTLQVVQQYNEALPDITEAPSMSPIPSASPSVMPTVSASPTTAPTMQPTTAPTLNPTTAPPVEEPTVADAGDLSTSVPTTFLEGLVGPTADETFAPSSAADTSVPTGTELPVSTASPAPMA